MWRRRKRIVSPNAIRQGRLAMINHVIGTVTDTVTTTESVTEIEEVIVTVREIRHVTVTKAVTDRETMKHQKKNGKIGVKTTESMTMGHKKQANKDSEALAALLHNKIILFPCNTCTILRCITKSLKKYCVYLSGNQMVYWKLHV